MTVHANARPLAGLIGPALMALATSEALNFHIWSSNIPSLTYLNGCLLFVAGLALVRAHNDWKPGWPVLITLTGWMLLLGGLFRMFAPEARQAAWSPATTALLGVLFAAGAVLAWRGYAPQRASVREGA